MYAPLLVELSCARSKSVSVFLSVSHKGSGTPRPPVGRLAISIAANSDFDDGVIDGSAHRVPRVLTAMGCFRFSLEAISDN